MKKQVPQADTYLPIELKFDRGNATYKSDVLKIDYNIIQQVISGYIFFLKEKLPKNFQAEIETMNLKVFGQATIHNRNNKKIVQQVKELAERIVFVDFTTEIARSKTILSKTDHKLQETYSGVYINIVYNITVFVKLTDKSIEPMKIQVPFYVQVPNAGRDLISNFSYPKPKYFMFHSQNLKGDVQPHHKFKIRGQLESQIIYFNDYLAGKITIDLCQSPIRSIDLQMMRNQKIEAGGKTFQQVTQIQMIQMCDGDVTRNLEIPINMILPRYYSCPSVSFKWMTITFQANLIVGFKDGYKVTANLPLKLIRS